ncbi:MAG: family 78 glycoside hydrolase catalytic domain [Christensenellaceae bacterium]|nr:family 78 glycoside hydrolase catalytic domain [Christensenellaceae bacterium]
MRVEQLTCDYMENPIGFDFDRPTLCWKIKGTGRNRRQTAYRIQVSGSGDFSAPLFDTQKTQSDESIGYRLELALSPRTRYFWRVCVWDEEDRPSDWSEAAWFETGKYQEPWSARWIGWTKEFPQLRGDFTLDRPVRSARAYACGVGLYTLCLNGQRVGDEYLAPNFNAYDSWLQYQTYDITPLLRDGANAMGCRLGNGYYKGRLGWPGLGNRRNIFGDRMALICEIHVTYEDGTEVVFGTDESWRAAYSPYLRAEIYDGEVYDARMHADGWCLPETSTEGWEPAVPVGMDMSLLTARKSLPVKLHERFPVKKVIHTPAGECVLDFGQNMAGLLRFETDAPEGRELLFQFGEALDQHGNFYRDNMRTALAEIRYIADGQRREYRPEFTFFGFRYVKVTGWPEPLNPACFTAEAIYSDMRQTGSFECSDPRVNQLFSNSLWGQKSNFVDVPTDCPQRDERMGWTGDAQVFCRTASMNMNAAAFYRKYLYDLAVEQEKDGYVAVTIPNYLRKTSVWQQPITGWSDAATVIPWTMYVYYGDKALLEKQYPSMKAWVDTMRKADTLGVDRYYGYHLGDWLAQDTKDPDNLYGLTPTDLIATAFYALSADIVARAAWVLGKADDAARYGELTRRVREAFRREYVSPNGRVVSETQTAQAIALFFDLLLPDQQAVTAEHLAERLRIDHLQLTTGFLGTPYLCPALSENGLNEYAYALLLQTRCPSWLYEIEMGATTVWERWNSVRPDGSFGPVSMNSLNHYAFGAVCEWLYRWVAGINPVEAAPGFKHSVLRPMPNSLLTSASASIDTPHGVLSSRWELRDGQIELTFEIPFNATAQIILPDAENAEVLENGELIDTSSIVRGSGTWTYCYRPSGRTIDRRAEK